jgi:hypothetical protein
MKQIQKDIINDSASPIDDLEDLVSSQDLPYLRFGKDELMVRYPNSWENFQSFWTWDKDLETLDVVASSLLKFEEEDRPAIYELLTIINNQLWIGHFDLTDEGSPTFRQTLMFHGLQGSTAEVVEDLFAIALAEYQRFFPAFQYVAKHKKTPQEAISLSLIETEGEA